ncbi:copper homeostasis membrane protein CopD [Cronobacter turicensis]|uniref:copper homeostasis membrane protein CopD n=1 Tax=Cronobacter turicensis TaxID=413502 RepID=UPI000CFD28F0|nr:copper homeostasis membrane protein CopD [Cronobacter turicensis]
MLESVYVALRFVHVAALMLGAGGALFCAWLAPDALGRHLAQRLRAFWRSAALAAVISAVAIFAVQAGLMGDGAADSLRPAIWQAMLSTRFGAVWLWQILLALVTLPCVCLAARRSGLLLILFCVQLVLLAGVGHGAMYEGLTGALQRLCYALHVLCAAWWFGGLVPLLILMRVAKDAPWRADAITAMMRFSRYGHVAVAGVIATGIINSILILGMVWPFESGYVRMLALKIALVAVMVAIALINRYVLVPKFSRQATAQRRFILMTKLEVALGALVLLSVSLFATWEPF